MNHLIELRHRALLDPDTPTGLRRALEDGAPLETIHLDARGRWWHEGEPFVHSRLIQLFHRSLHQTPGGTWLLTIPPFSYPVTVEHTGRFIHRILRQGPSCLLCTPDGRERPFDPDALVTDGLDGLYTEIEGETARFVEDAWKTLSPFIEQVDNFWVLDWRGRRSVLGNYLGPPAQEGTKTQSYPKII